MIFDIWLESIILGLVPWAIAGIIAVMLALRPYSLMALLFLMLHSMPSNAMECSNEPDNKGYWSWRYIKPHDNKKCWYRGSRIIPKSELHWIDQKQHIDVLPKHAEVKNEEVIDAQKDSGPMVAYPDLMSGTGTTDNMLTPYAMTQWPLVYDLDQLAIAFVPWQQRIKQ